MSEWIDVKDELPENIKLVIVCVGKHVSTAWLVYHKDGKYWEDAYAHHLEGITHWQPLPSPPKP